MAYQPHSQASRTFPHSGYCPSYFVESNDDEDDGLYARAAAERVRDRTLARLTQKALGEELSRSTADEYQEDVLDHMERMEAETMPDLQSIEIQTEIQWFMRPYLLDFLLEAHHAFQLLPETLHLAVNLLDRYCSRRVVYKRHYQLVGCAALLIAAKYGDRKDRVPTIRDLKLMCCSSYDDDMFTQMEWHVLQTLNWIIGHPTVTGFSQIALTEVAPDAELEHMSWYISEMALYHKDFIPIRPSVMARSSLVLARCILGRQQPRYDGWSARYDPQVVLNLSSHLSHPSQALLRKYASPHLSTVSTTIDLFLKHQSMLTQRASNTADDMPRINPDHDSTVNYLTPQTPRKAMYTTTVHGMLTPPITPNKDNFINSGYGMNQILSSRITQCNPTSPPACAEMQQHQQPNSFCGPQPSYHSQPQFV